MLLVGNVLVSFDVLTRPFMCDLGRCRGACCVEGDAGAPITLDEVGALEDALPHVWADLSTEARAVIQRQGVACTDPEGELVTSTVGSRECVFAYREAGCWYCAVEKAWRRGLTPFVKPISCHLYPIRVSDYGRYLALNYDRWDVCQSAIPCGRRANLPVYRFLREPLIRRFGADWYQELDTAARELLAQGLIADE